MSKDLIDVIEGLLSEGANDKINNTTSDNQKKQKEQGSSADTQSVLGKTSGATLDGGGDKDVGAMGKGKFASDASPDTQGTMGKTKGAALDAGGDKDVGKIDGKKALPSGASSKVEADKGPHSLATDKGLGEELSEEEAFELISALDLEDIEGFMQTEEFESLDEISKQALMNYRGSAKIHRRQNDEIIGSQMASNSQVNKAEKDNEKRTKGIDMSAKKLAIKEEEAKDKGDMDGDGKDEPDDEEYMDNKDAAIKKSDEDESEKDESEEDESDEDEMKEETEGETLKKVSGEANSKQRPAVEKGDNAPKTKQDPFTGHAPHVQASDAFETPTKVNPKGAVSEESEELEEEVIEIDDLMSVMEMTEEQLEALSEGDYDTAVAAYKAKGGTVKKGKTVKARGSDSGYNQGTVKGGSKGNRNFKDPKAAYQDANKKTPDAKYAKEETEDLDEDFKVRAEVIFETAVNQKTAMLRETMEAEFASKLDEAKVELDEKVAAYVEEAVAEWVKENSLEIKYSLRTEIAENFIRGLKGLFEDAYIEIPEEDYAVVDELTEAVELYKEQLETQTTSLTEARAELLSMKRASIVETLSDDLTETQKIKLESLAEHVEAADIKEFETKVKELKEGYFDPKSEQPFLGSLTEEVFTGSMHAFNENVDPSVAVYASFLGKALK